MMLRLAVAASVALLAVPAAAVPAHASAKGDEWCTTTVTIRDIGVRETVWFYYGAPDDAEGTAIQNRGLLSAPVGPNGGSAGGPGEVGNFFVAGHRNSHGGVFNDLRDLDKNDTITVVQKCPDAKRTFTYKVTRTATYINFFSKAGRAKQVADVPFAPGEVADKAYVTLSTCATQEDHARGDWRADRFGNPVGRYVVVGELVSERAAPPAAR